MSNGNNKGTQRNGTGNGLVHVNGNGHKPDAAMVSEHELLWDGLAPAVTQALGEPLDPEMVSRREGRGGKLYDYLEGHVVIDQANRIFGYGGWGYELVGDVTLRRVESVDSRTGEVKVASAYSAPVRVTVAGALPRTDVGVHPVAEDTVDGHDTAMKAAVTDGLKRALRSFGVQFGNGFYGDQAPSSGSAQPQHPPAKARANGGPPSSQAQAKNPVRQAQSLPSTGSRGGSSESQAQPKNRNDSEAEKLRKRVFKMAAEQGFDEDGVRTAVMERTGKSIDDLTAAELRPLVEAAANKLNEMRQAQAA